MLTPKVRWLSNNFHRPVRRKEKKKKQAPKVRINCEPQFDTKSSQQQTYMLQKSKTVLQTTGYPCHRKAGDLGQPALFKDGPQRIQLTFTPTTTHTKTKRTTE